ncbi:MAG: histidinol-phosphate transaminase [Victivallaceae bacterium]|nr:histidinol-phosphate transaminase [Victivallaceae bacterium]
MNKLSYFRPAIDAMSGYTPGEQPKLADITKLNTNENPYPPAPGVSEVLKSFAADKLRLYPDPMCTELRHTAAGLFKLDIENIIAGNGSDDILTMIFRCFTDESRPCACLEPTYSLYPVLANIQGCEAIKINLNEDFSLPDNLLEQAERANLLIITRPNAPTGNSFTLPEIEQICAEFKGIVLVDEAYVDFANDSCIGLVKKFDNLIVSRTASKSYSLAGGRLGLAMADVQLIDGMMKVKDSYNVNALTQVIAIAALRDQGYLKSTVEKIINSRNRLTAGLIKLGFRVIDSEANFVFAAPPDGDGERYFNQLREQAIIVRYFPGSATGRFVRITVGTDEQIDRLLEFTSTINLGT